MVLTLGHPVSPGTKAQRRPLLLLRDRTGSGLGSYRLTPGVISHEDQQVVSNLDYDLGSEQGRKCERFFCLP